MTNLPHLVVYAFFSPELPFERVLGCIDSTARPLRALQDSTVHRHVHLVNVSWQYKMPRRVCQHLVRQATPSVCHRGPWVFLGKELLCIWCDVQCMLCVTAKQLFLHRAVGHLCVCARVFVLLSVCVCMGVDCLVSLSLTETEKDTDVVSHWHLSDSTVLNSYPAPGGYMRSRVSYSHITSNPGTQTLA